MGHVIYHKESTRFAPLKKKHYASESAAKAALTRAVNSGKVNREDYAIAESGDFNENIEKMVVRKNLMSGKEFKEPVNTPYYCSPSSETYWSM